MCQACSLSLTEGQSGLCAEPSVWENRALRFYALYFEISFPFPYIEASVSCYK